MNRLPPLLLQLDSRYKSCGDSCSRTQHYVINNPSQAYRRVLLSHSTPHIDRSRSVVGETGHIERANAWTHIIGAALFALYAFVRIGIVNTNSLASQLSAVAIVLTAATFAVSAVYHVFMTVPGIAIFVRTFDHLAIYVAMAASAVADAAMVTRDLRDAPLQTTADPVLAALVLGTYFVVRRFLVSRKETLEFVFENECSLGLFRANHSDLEHAGLRIVGVGILTLVWILLLPAAFHTLPASAAVFYLVARLLAVVLLASAIVLDNFYFQDRAFLEPGLAWLQPCACQSKKLGILLNAHAWWHIISFCSAVLLTVSREYGVNTLGY